MNPKREPHEEIRQLFRRYVPEVRAGTVEIVSLARDMGRRTCVTVRSHDERVSAVAACSGGHGAYLKAIGAELGAEKLTLLQWHSSPEQLIKEAFLYPGVQVSCESSMHQAMVTIDLALLQAVARGRNDRMVPVFEELTGLVSELTGWEIKMKKTGKR